MSCDPVYEYLFKFDIWLWYFLWMNCCVFDKVKCFFECLVCWPAVSDCWKGFIMLGIFDWCDAWYFYVNGVNFCHVISFDIVNVFFNICFKFWFGCFNFSSDSDYITRIFYPLFKWCGNCGNILLLFNYFWWKKLCCFFYHLGIFLEAQCLWFEINQFISNFLRCFILFLSQLIQFFVFFLKHFMLFLKNLIRSRKHGLDCVVKVIFWHKWW